MNYDLHLSAYSIARETIEAVEKLGFSEDLFANSTRCEMTSYHATYRGDMLLPNNRLWDQTCSILSNDSTFKGGLEEEKFLPGKTVFFDGLGTVENPLPLPKLEIVPPTEGQNKACDIHININVADTTPSKIDYLEKLQIASFEKKKDGKLHRIYTITCDDYLIGELLFEFLKNYFSQISGVIGKMKMEKTVRFFRHPSNAPTLPLTSSQVAINWLKQCHNHYEK